MKFILIIQILIDISYFLIIILLFKKAGMHLQINIDKETMKTAIQKIDNEILYGNSNKTEEPIGIYEATLKKDKLIPTSVLEECLEKKGVNLKMIIISQDKEQLINLDNVTRIFIEDFSEDGDGFGIGADTNSAESQCWDLGYYKTRERAKEVLQEITNKYKKYFICANGSTTELPKIFEMPKE